MLVETQTEIVKTKLLAQTVLECFEENVHFFKDKIAVVHQNGNLTYDSLNKKANSLAFHLKNHIEPGALVGIYLESSIECLISILAILKTGAAYIPLDIEAPSARIETILKDSKPHLILTNTPLESQLTFDKTNILNLDGLVLEEKAQNIKPVQTLAENLLYIMYTSGSTGSPKGCMIPHRAVLNLVKNEELIEFRKHEHIAQISNIAFDASTFEIWGALLNGATLFIFPRKKLFCLDDLSLFLKKNSITVLFLTTALFNLIVKNKPDCLDSIHFLMFGGEKANPAIVNQFINRCKSLELKHLQLIHVYGPTENTTFSTKLLLKPNQRYERNIPIGKPLANIELYILDEELQEVPPGVMGEIHLCGANLSLGYLNTPDITKSRFFLHPILKNKIYKTGDFAYWDNDGNVNFVCRMDSQIKIRGYRVELSEIEAALLEHALVDLVYIDLVLQDNEYIINAYITSVNNSKKIEQGDLYHYMHQKLPDYMIPHRIFLLERFPLNQNGKIDKIALRKMDVKPLHATQEVHRPTNQVEKIITVLLSELLKEPNIGIHHNFFDLGFNSLMVTDACSKLNQKMNSSRKVKELDFFTYPTIQLLAKFISNHVDCKNLANSADRALLQRKIKLRKQHAR